MKLSILKKHLGVIDHHCVLVECYTQFYSIDFLIIGVYHCSMVAAFGSGAMFTLVSGMGAGAPNQAANAITSGLFFALVQGGIFKVSTRGKEISFQKWLKFHSACIF